MGQNCGKIGRFCRNFAGIFGANLAGKQSIKKRWILWLFSGQISPEIDWICADQTSVFNVFLTEVVICSFNNNMLQKWTNGKAFKSWLVPSFSQHNLRLIVSECCLHVSVMKFWHKFVISRIYLNFVAPRPHEISEALTNGIFLQYTQSCSDCSIDLCILWDACHELFYVFGDSYASGMQDVEETKSLIQYGKTPL